MHARADLDVWQPMAPRPLSERRLLLRFAVGALELGIARLLVELRRADNARDEAPASNIGHHRLLGACIAVPTAAAAAGRVARKRLFERVRPLWRAARTTRPGASLARSAGRARAAVGDTLAKWDAIGTAEAFAARELAVEALDRLYDAAFERLAGPELGQLIQDESAGLTRSVVRELRELTVRADSRAERLLRRRRRKAR